MRGKKWIRWVDRVLGICFVILVKLLRRRRDLRNPERVLIVMLGNLGDALLLIPTVRYLASRDISVDVVCHPNNARLFKSLVEVGNVYQVSANQVAFSPFYMWSLRRQIRCATYDAILDAEQWIYASIYLTLMLNTYVVGFRTKGSYRHIAFDAFISRSHSHVALDFVRLAQKVDISDSLQPIGNLDYTLPKSNSAGQVINTPVLLVHVGGGGTPRHAYQRIWPPQKYVECINSVASQVRGLEVQFTGSPSEVELIEQVISGLKDVRYENLAGRTTYDELVAKVIGARVVLCGNTGVMHLAAACETPVVALHGPTDPLKWGPVGEKHRIIRAGLPCSPCLDLGWEYGCSKRPCMENISVQTVVDELVGLLERRKVHENAN